MTEKSGVLIGYKDGIPVAAAIFGNYGETRHSAIASMTGLRVREFSPDDLDLEAELDKWADAVLNRTRETTPWPP